MNKDSRGFALVIVLLLSAMLGILGTSFVLMSDTEIRIADNERRDMQAIYAAESGTRIVKRWFDAPMSPSNLANPGLGAIDRTLRLIDADGDPGTPPVAADGTSGKPYYKQGVDRNGDGDDDVFRKPYRDSLLDTLLGTETGPDMRIDASASTAARDFLNDLSDRMFSGYPGLGRKARIVLIDIYAPPYALSSGSWVRYGMATVKVVARIYRERPDGTEVLVGERMVKTVLNEIPYNPGGDLGPLHSCTSIQWNGEFTVHWGVATAVSWTDLHSQHEKLPASIPRDPSGSTTVDLLWGWDNDANFLAYKNAIETENLKIDDPWLRLVSGGDLVEPANDSSQQPWPFGWVPGDPWDEGEIPYHPGVPSPDPYDGVIADGSHANVLQNTPPGCPTFDYEQWKVIAQAGGLSTHYYVWDHDDVFRENGTGPAGTFRDLTDTRTGLFFFDTMDGLPPHDDDSDGVFDNLTPELHLSGGKWGTRGMIYLNAASLRISGVNGRPETYRAPGEPFQDRNANGRFDPGEQYINLAYLTELDGAPGNRAFRADAADDLQDDGTHGGVVARNSRGPFITADANTSGIVYTSGYYDATGNGVHYGTLVTYQGIGLSGPSGGTPDHYWNESLRSDWPPDGWDLPRVVVTRWETDR